MDEEQGIFEYFGLEFQSKQEWEDLLEGKEAPIEEPNSKKRKRSLTSTSRKKVKSTIKNEYAFFDLFGSHALKESLVPAGEIPVEKGGCLTVNERVVITGRKWYELAQAKFYYEDTVQQVPYIKIKDRLLNGVPIAMVDGRKVITKGALYRRNYLFSDNGAVLSSEQKLAMDYDEHRKKLSFAGREVHYIGSKPKTVTVLERPGLQLTIKKVLMTEEERQLINQHLDQIESLLGLPQHPVHQSLPQSKKKSAENANQRFFQPEQTVLEEIFYPVTAENSVKTPERKEVIEIDESLVDQVLNASNL
ncbi:MAG: hypothetical protein WC785_09885 [Tatlockia sp.]|jgi:hypothetical protein